MMNYEIKKNGKLWEIYETRTKQVVKTCSSSTKAQILKTHLNCGGGFDSWTPAFMLQK